MAEKQLTKTKPVPRKRATKKTEEPKPVSKIQQAVEQVKRQGLNWEALGGRLECSYY